MGVLLSKLRRDDDRDYEKILSEIDEKLRRAEISLSEIAVREKKATVVWLIYSVFFYFLYVLAYILYLRAHLNGLNFLLASLALVVAPVLVYVVRNLIRVFFERQKSNEEAHVENLLALQKDKVEELKKKSSYYATKSLLDRYENPANRLGGKQNPSQRPNPSHPPASAPARGGLPSPNGKGLPMKQTGPPNRSGMPPNSMPIMPGTPNTPMASGASSAVSVARQRIPPASADSVAGGMQTPSFTQPQRHATPNMSMPTPFGGQTPQPRAWYDKLVDAVIGDEGPDTKYALICGQCFAHNGLVVAEEYDDIRYVCPNCNYFNPPRRKRQNGGNGNDPARIDLDVCQTRKRPGDASIGSTPTRHSFSRRNSKNDDTPTALASSMRSQQGLNALPPVARNNSTFKTQSPLSSPRGSRSSLSNASINTPRTTSKLRNHVTPTGSPTPSAGLTASSLALGGTRRGSIANYDGGNRGLVALENDDGQEGEQEEEEDENEEDVSLESGVDETEQDESSPRTDLGDADDFDASEDFSADVERLPDEHDVEEVDDALELDDAPYKSPEAGEPASRNEAAETSSVKSNSKSTGGRKKKKGKR